MKCRYVITKCINPYRNLATEQFLMRLVESGMFILFLWQNDNTVVIGRNQDPYSECRVDALINDGGHLARRRSGGGAVYHDLGNLNFSILTRADDCTISYKWIVESALKQMGLEVEYNGRNDLTYQGRKFSGNALYNEGDMLCQHGTILISTSLRRMSGLLTPEKGKLDRNHVSSVESRVINLSEISEDITVKSVAEAFISVCDGSPLVFEPDKAYLDRLFSFYSGKKWIYGGIR